MSSSEYTAFIVEKQDGGKFQRNITTRSVADLPAGEVLIRVRYSSLNYKDALSATGHPGVTTNFPHTPGIDAAGVVESSVDNRFQPGDQVIVHGYDLGMNTPGGYGQYIRVPADWIVRLPDGLTVRESMMYGTAGFTAAMSLDRVMKMDITPDEGPVCVTGASGGVGSMAVALFAQTGYKVEAVTGKESAHPFLKKLGAEKILPRDAVSDTSGKPLLSRTWNAAVDTVGGDILSTLLRSMEFDGLVASCGNAASHNLALTVYPFILRGVNLCGIDSGNCSVQYRQTVWDKLGGEWSLASLDTIVREISLDSLDTEVQTILEGNQVGRVLVNLDG